MINLTLGPVSMYQSTLDIGNHQVPYFRTIDFSKIMLENEALLSSLLQAPKNSRTVFLTCSGTGGMESVVANILTPLDKVLIINGGTFGQRFVQLCQIYDIQYTEIILEYGKQIILSDLEQYQNKEYTALLVNMCDTSTGILYDMPLISSFCYNNNILLIVDAIGCFITDEIKMDEWFIDIVITSSQKALACPAGVAMITMSPRALRRIDNQIYEQNLYLSLKRALYNKTDGQTPWTPAVSIMYQINDRLKSINSNGLAKTQEDIAALAQYFRVQVQQLPLAIFTQNLAHSVTSLYYSAKSSKDICEELQQKYDIYICPSDLMDGKILRVGHIGNITKQDYDHLISALKSIL